LNGVYAKTILGDIYWLFATSANIILQELLLFLDFNEGNLKEFQESGDNSLPKSVSPSCGINIPLLLLLGSIVNI
jgi:hypothetical protein